MATTCKGIVRHLSISSHLSPWSRYSKKNERRRDETTIGRGEERLVSFLAHHPRDEARRRDGVREKEEGEEREREREREWDYA